MHLTDTLPFALSTFFLLPSVLAYAMPNPTITPAPQLHLRSPGPSPEKISIKPFTLQSLDLPSNTCHPTIAPDKNGFVPPSECNALYRFYPSFGAAILFSILFGIVTVTHISQAAAYKKKFCWVIITAAIWESGSFITRAISTRHQQSNGLALVSQLLVLLAPLWVNAFIYMVLARIVWYYIPSHSLFSVKASTFALVFVTLDFVSFVIQIIGGSMASPGAPQDQIMRGIHLYMGGIGMQEAFIVIFIVLVMQFHMQMLRLEGDGTLEKLGRNPSWRWPVITIYASLVLITIRIIFRLAEFSAGIEDDNPLPFHEAYFYIFEAIPMFFAIAIMSLAHPGKVLQGPESDMPQNIILRKLKCCGRRNKRVNRSLTDDEMGEAVLLEDSR